MKTAIASQFAKQSRLALALAITSLGALSAAAATVNFNDGGTHTINDDSYENDIISISNSTTLNIAPGAVIEGRVEVYDTSNLNISGGEFGPTGLSGRVWLFNSSNGLITGGSFGGTGATGGTGGVEAFNNSVLIVEGGSFGATGTSGSAGFIRPRGNSLVEIRGGDFGGPGPGSLTGSIQAIANATVNITGGAFGVGTGSGNGTFIATDTVTFNISGGTFLPRTDGASHVNVFTPDARVFFHGCAFSELDGTPLALGLLPNSNTFRFNATFSNETTFEIKASTIYGGTVGLVLGCDCNADPLSNAGSDQTVECAGEFTSVQLDGTGSSDPDGDELTYEWSAPAGVTLNDFTSATPTGQFPLGPSLVTLTVTDGNGGIATDDVLISVEDTTPPVVVCTTDLISLLPPNHSMRTVQICVEVTEDCPDFELTCEITSNEPDDANGDGEFTGDVDGVDGYTAPVTLDLTFDEASGCFLGEVDLRAERDGAESGRTYSITCEVTDIGGNTATASCVVVVPHDRRKAK